MYEQELEGLTKLLTQLLPEESLSRSPSTFRFLKPHNRNSNRFPSLPHQPKPISKHERRAQGATFPSATVLPKPLLILFNPSAEYPNLLSWAGKGLVWVLLLSLIE
jgi:hypothetical protein